MNKLKFFLPLVVLILIAGAGCAASNPSSPTTATPPSSHHMPTPSTTETSDHSEIEHIAKPAGARIDLENKNSFKPGEVTFTFTLYGLDGHEFGPDDLKIAHEKKMHFILVRDDMTGFQHVHPEYVNGKWTVKTTIAEAGQYQLYIDVEPVEEKPVVLRVSVVIGTPTVTKNFPTPQTDRSAEDQGYRATLTATAIKTNEPTKLTFTITKNGQAVTQIDPYLGAYGHVVLLRHNDPDDFFHVHPLSETKPMNGIVEFQTEFPVKGRYTLYAQFNTGGSVKIFPITIDVSEEGAATGTAPMDSASTTQPMMNHHGG